MVGAAFGLLLLAGVPIALVLAGSALFYILWSGQTVLLQSYAQQLFSSIESYGLLAIPLFMLTGELMNEGGITGRLVGMASAFMGRVKGGLAYINLVVNMMVASIMGSATAQMAVMSRAMVPAMEKEGYDRPFAAATTAAGSLLSPIIPPSMLFVIYGVLAQISIGDMFIAGILPGLLLALSFLVVLALIGTVKDLPRGRAMDAAGRWAAVRAGVPTLIIPVVIVGGIIGGIATPTESAAVAALAAFLIGRVLYKEMTFARIPVVLLRAGFNASIVVFIVATAGVFGWVIIYEQVPQALAARLAGLTQDPFVFLLLVNLGLIVVGMVIDGIAALILLVPILLPIAVQQYGIDPFHFGVVVCLNLVLGLLTPPVGAGLFVMTAMTGVRPGALVKALAPFLLASFSVLMLLSWQGWIVTVLIR
ncbi:TRAP dicarboxylate transporter, DctM subunit [Oceaniovalibus guishaninsula JLT2003]|uniref:TRAP transporter large permease protein n=1 Tax=Oceaniovalibus guishaninsula JLT2003 TaxID=1231392 RepID=K2HBU3_9RHOB|nr:TRAP transporter large permease [Oceaniovalibus guishaninsula]EKE44953.1 TRAP dicarboxylate transporter, DctM subunit [Oceaniovalibus guishaninsula JLT2003]